MNLSARAPRWTWKTLAWGLLAVASTLRVHAEALVVIPLQYRLAEELLPILQPLLPAGAALTGTGDVLLVRADDATLQQVRAALATLDRPPRQLLLTVGQATAGTGAAASVRGSATVAASDVPVGGSRPPLPASGARVVVLAGRGQVELQDVSSVRALEGRETYVALTASQPFPSAATVHDGSHGVTRVHTAGHRDAQTGFVATPRLSGDLVTLEISPSQQRLGRSRHDAPVAGQTLTTTVSGRLGEWIELGGIRAIHTNDATGLGVWETGSELTHYSAWVMVEEVP
jgi:hypothetical protein